MVSGLWTQSRCHIPEPTGTAAPVVTRPPIRKHPSSPPSALESSQGSEVISSSHEDAARIDNQLQETQAWKREIQQWLTSQAIALPYHLEHFQSSHESDSRDYQQECQELRSQVSQLEEQLIALDQDHQTTLEVALANLTDIKQQNKQFQLRIADLAEEKEAFDQSQLQVSEECQSLQTKVSSLEEQLKATDEQRQAAVDETTSNCNLLQEQNRKLQSQLSELVQERDSLRSQSSKVNLTTGLLAGDGSNAGQRELLQLENDHQYLRQEIEHFQSQFEQLTLKLSTFEDIGADNQNLKERIAEQERNFVQEKDSLKEDVESLSRVNETADLRLKRMAELEEENDQLKSSLNEVIQTSQLVSSSESQIEQLIAENRQLQDQVDGLTVTEKRSTAGNDALADAGEYTKEIAALNLKNESLCQQLDELKEAIEQHVSEKDSKSTQNDELVSTNLCLTEELKSCKASWDESQQQQEEKLTESSLYNQQLQQELEQHQTIMKELQASTQKATQELISKNQEMERTKCQAAELVSECQQLREKLASLEAAMQELRAHSQALQEQAGNRVESETSLTQQIEELQKRCQSYADGEETLTQQLEAARESVGRRDAELADLKTQMEAAKETELAQFERLSLSIAELQQEKEQLNLTLQAFQQQREQLVQTVQQKHQEAVSYHSEAQRMAKICEDLQVRLNEYVDLNDELSRWRIENDSLKANQSQLQGEIDRLRSHLLAVEENYTTELLKSQEKEKTLVETLQAAEEKMSDQWRKNDKMSSLKEKHRQLVAEKQRAEATNRTLELSLEKLQHVLDQFTRERERDIVVAQRELAQKLSRVETLHSEKETEIAQLRKKLAEAQLGLEAAGRLTQQLDNTTAALSVAREEVRMKEEELARFRQQITQLQTGTESKVDRSLVKNLVVGYFSAPSAKRVEVLRIIATVLDFTSDEREKTGLADGASAMGGWASGLLKMSRTRTNSASSTTGDADKSLSEAFISFLETESVRHTPPKLPSQLSISEDTSAPPAISTVLTTFHPGRNEPTILRDALRDSET